MVTSAEQRTLDWYRVRLGNITGSMVGVLMKEGRNDTFSETAKAYLYQLAAERSMNPAIVNDDELFEMYLYQVDVTTKAMRFGTEQEGKAELEAIRERMAEVIVTEVEKSLLDRLDAKTHQKLIDKSLTKVVLQ